MKVGLITMEWADNRIKDSVGSSRIRGRWMLPYWPELEEYQIGKQYDVLIFQKAYWTQMIEMFEGIKIFDLCDPDWLEDKDVFKWTDLVDAVVTSTPALRDYMLKLRPKKKIICIPDRIHLPEHKPVKKDHQKTTGSCVHFGYSHNTPSLMRTLDYLLARNLTLVVVSDQSYTPPKQWERLKVINIKYSYPAIHKELIKHDFALLPPPEGERGKFKSDNKVLTCWALKVPVARIPKDLQRYADPKERKKEAEMRYNEVREKRDVKQSVEEYKGFINEIQSRDKRS